MINPIEHEPILSFEAFTDYAVYELGVSPDAAVVVTEAEYISTVAAVLGEHRSGVSIRASQVDLQRRHAQLFRAGMLPEHLQEQDAYLKRYYELLGTTHKNFHQSEVASAIVQNRQAPPAELQQQFEYQTARLFSEVLRTPSYLELIPALMSSTFILGSNQNQITSANGLVAALPADHAGIVQCAPTMRDTLSRCGEAAHDSCSSEMGWHNIALLSSTHFNEGFTRAIGPAIFGLKQEQIFTSGQGIAMGSADLVQQRSENERLRIGFGAMVLSAVHHLDGPDIRTAIENAPRLLAPGGLLLLSDMELFPNRSGSVWEMINHARQVFGSDPHTLGVMTTEDGKSEGRQAVFVQPS